MTKEKKIFQPITFKSICLTYKLLLTRGFVSFQLTQDAEKKIEAVVANINAIYFGTEIYKTTEEKVVAYLYFLIKDHPFTDGNKRTACLVFEIACFINEITPHFTDFTLDELAVFIEKVQENDHQSVIRAIAEILF